jgi:hypothetical protein
MGSRYDNGGTHPPEGGGSADGLPDLPPEWGTVVVPDDASALAGEAELVRRELRRARRRRRLYRLAPGGDAATLAIPLLIMVVAILATLGSLLVVTWPSSVVRRTPAPNPTGPAPPSTVPDVRLTDRAGTPVQLRDSLPAVLLLVDGCDACGPLVHTTAAAAPQGVSVLVVGRTVPAVTSGDSPRVRALADPDAALATLFAGLPADAGTATVVLLKGDGTVAEVVPGTTTAQRFLPALRTLR